MRHKHETPATHDDYLWDSSGQPDPEIQRLEHALGRFRHDRPAPAFPSTTTLATQEPAWWHRITFTLSTARLAAATLTILAIASSLWLSLAPRPPLATPDGWRVQLSVAPQQAEYADASTAKNTLLRVGSTLETDAASKASIAVAEIGRLEVEPMTRLRLLQSGTNRKRIALDRGTIHATIWAPPGQFVVDTPSAVAVDLGCMYTLHVDESGNGILRTTLGWVGFHRNGRESFIPAGAACPTYLQSGPGTPYFEDASEAFRSALSRLDSASELTSDRKPALETVLHEARARDAFTLWHLFSRVTIVERSAVYDRLAKLVPPPSGVTRGGILRLDRAMLDSWWNAFDLGDVSFWRHWEQTWTGREGHPN
jgi:hypothetical protein